MVSIEDVERVEALYASGRQVSAMTECRTLALRALPGHAERMAALLARQKHIAPGDDILFEEFVYHRDTPENLDAAYIVFWCSKWTKGMPDTRTTTGSKGQARQVLIVQTREDFAQNALIALRRMAGTMELNTQRATPAPVETASDAPAKPAAPEWSLKTSIKKWPGYRLPLHQFLKDAYVAGKPCPKAQDVLDAWKLNPPHGFKVIKSGRHDELEYELNHGHKKTADLKAIQAAIDGLVIQID